MSISALFLAIVYLAIPLSDVSAADRRAASKPSVSAAKEAYKPVGFRGFQWKNDYKRIYVLWPKATPNRRGLIIKDETLAGRRASIEFSIKEEKVTMVDVMVNAHPEECADIISELTKKYSAPWAFKQRPSELRGGDALEIEGLWVSGDTAIRLYCDIAIRLIYAPRDFDTISELALDDI